MLLWCTGRARRERKRDTGCAKYSDPRVYARGSPAGVERAKHQLTSLHLIAPASAPELAIAPALLRRYRHDAVDAGCASQKGNHNRAATLRTRESVMGTQRQDVARKRRIIAAMKSVVSARSRPNPISSYRPDISSDKTGRTPTGGSPPRGGESSRHKLHTPNLNGLSPSAASSQMMSPTVSPRPSRAAPCPPQPGARSTPRWEAAPFRSWPYAGPRAEPAPPPSGRGARARHVR